MKDEKDQQDFTNREKQYEEKKCSKKTKNADQPIYIQGSLHLNLLDYPSCSKVNEYLNL